MARRSDTDPEESLAIRAAWLHYAGGLTQAAVAWILERCGEQLTVATPLGLGKPRKVPQQEAHRVPQAAIAVGHPFQDFLPDPQIDRVIRLRHPKPQDIGPIFANHLLRRDSVAERLGHLHALLVQREAMRQHTPVRRAPLRPAGLQHRRMEPPAMLVGAFQIQVRRPVAAHGVPLL